MLEDFDRLDDELSQADLSHLHVSEMTDAQKAELRRRYVAFVRVNAKVPQKRPAPKPAKEPAKWIPGARPRY